MSLSARIITCLLLGISTTVIPQDYFSFFGGNYSGIGQVYSNPAAAVNNPLKLDILLTGTDISFNNTWLAVRRASLTDPELRQSWKNRTPNVPDNFFKNLVSYTSRENQELFFEQRLMLPSVLADIDAKNAFAFTCNFRQIGNVTGISAQVAHLFENEFDLSVTRNNRVRNKNIAALQMSWAEYGFTYARVLVRSEKHLLKAGVTPKLLQGVQSTYLSIKDLDFLFSSADSLSYFNAGLSFARSEGAGAILSTNATDLFGKGTGLYAGLDIGIIYEWRKETPARQTQKENGTPDYKLKAGVSLVDIGRIRFRKTQNYYDLDVAISEDDIIRYISAGNLRRIDSLLQLDFPANTGNETFRVSLPLALNSQLDYCLSPHFYLNLSTHFSGFNRQTTFSVYNYNSISFTPRFESYWLEIALPLSYNTLSAKRGTYISPGLSLRVGPLLVGSNDVGFLFAENFRAMNFFALLKVPLPDTPLKSKKRRSWSEKYKSK